MSPQSQAQMFKNKKVLITGSSGFVGKNFVPLFKNLDAKLFLPKKSDYDLTIQSDVKAMFNEIKPEIVFHFGALVGGLQANMDRPADFCYENLVAQTHMLHEAFLFDCEKYITLMGGCSYPGNANSPIIEEDMWNGFPHDGAAPYSSAKRMNIVMSQAYRKQYGFNSIVLVPGNIYGPYDNFDLNNSHVIPALIRKYYEAKLNNVDEIIAWGSGKPERDFIYIDDAVKAILKASEIYNSSEIINISSGNSVSIRELTETIANVVNFKGKITWDASKPDGQLKKGFDVTKMKSILDFQPKTSLKLGIEKTYDWFVSNYNDARLNS